MKMVKGLVSILVVMGLAVTLSWAQEELAVEGMIHAEFARWLVAAIEAEGYLPPAAVDNDYFIFLTNLGVVPPDGWNPEGVITGSDLDAILGPDASGLSFDEKVEKLKEKLTRALRNRTRIKRSVSPEIR